MADFYRTGLIHWPPRISRGDYPAGVGRYFSRTDAYSKLAQRRLCAGASVAIFGPPGGGGRNLSDIFGQYFAVRLVY